MSTIRGKSGKQVRKNGQVSAARESGAPDSDVLTLSEGRLLTRRREPSAAPGGNAGIARTSNWRRVAVSQGRAPGLVTGV